MSHVSEHLRIPFAPVAAPQAVVVGPGVRFTVLTPRLIRLEQSNGAFEDRASQPFWYRRQPVPDFRSMVTDAGIEIETEYLHLRYDPRAGGFTPESLAIELKGWGVTWRYGDPDSGNLLGTARTLDRVSGSTPLGPGLLSRSGWAIVDDSDTLVFNEEGWLERRPEDPSRRDLYFFGHGHDYLGCLQDYARVAGPVPLLPRWALGNWWSRYWAYSQDELKGLMHEFEAHGIPLSVCIIDMDWHITETGNACSGWTGFTWNRELWPDPESFIAWLHEKGLRTALNVHPAEGVHPHEAMYEEMARDMGIDPATQEPVPFDIADPRFAQSYFQRIFHPLEEQGVDFWWMDWQQGEMSRLPGLDPLWWLNHLHFYDLARDGRKRPFIFSRWGSLGNHRYQIGFSGDTVVTWDSLAYQPYFTATAANVAYSWWSHDIGGHMGGIEDPELYTRWVQFGLFSPILRLHCTKNPYQERRPWGYGAEVLRITRDAMQLRHAFIPYIYTMSWRNHQESMPLVAPMYYRYPEREEAYSCPNQYLFGSELLVAPHTRPADPDTRLSRQAVWLPEGDWFGFFDGRRYAGGGWQAVYGTLEDIPAFAQAGAIVPLGTRVEWGGVENPAEMEVWIFPGADNRFELYEDDGQSMAYTEGRSSLTAFSQTWRGNELEFHINPARGDWTHLPAERCYSLYFRGIRNPSTVQLRINGRERPVAMAYCPKTDTLRVQNICLAPGDNLALTLAVPTGDLISDRDRTVETCDRMLRAFRLDSWVKASLGARLPEIVQDSKALLDYDLALPEAQTRALIEAIEEAGVDIITHAGAANRIVLWNNRQQPDMRYVVSALDRRGLANAEHGAVPRFAAIPLDERLHWRVRVDYMGMAQVVWERE